MPFPNLSSFLAFLEKKGDLCRVPVPVDPVLEMTEIATRVVKTGGPAILFDNVKGSEFPAVINLFGAPRRIEWALGRSPREVGEELVRFADVLLKPSLERMWRLRRVFPRLWAFRPRQVARAPFQGNEISPVDLERLPLAQSWPEDGGRFFTFPLVITQSPVDGRINVGVYRMQLYNQNLTGMHWQIGKGGGFHYMEAEKKDVALDVAVVVGADPILMLCGILPLPEGIDEMAFAGFLRGSATGVFPLGSDRLPVPAEAEFVLAGIVPPHRRQMEGPYGDHFGHYSHQALFPVFEVKRIYHRSRPVFPLAVVGKPPQEDNVIGAAVQDILLPLIKIMHPEIVDLWAYPAAGFHNLTVVSVRQRFRKEAIKTGLWILGEGQLALSKVVVLVGEEVNVRDAGQVLTAVRSHFDPGEDFTLLPRTSQDTLDFTGHEMNLGSKMIMDATPNGKGPPSSALPKNVDPGRFARVDPRIRGVRILANTMLVLQVTGEGREIVEKVVKSPEAAELSVVAAVSPDVPLDDEALLLWGLFTRFDCRRDTMFAGVVLSGGHPSYSGPLGIDATVKVGYPRPLTMSREIVERVDKRWPEYGFRE